MSRTAREPRDRCELIGSPTRGPAVFELTTMCGMCNARISASTSATRKLGNGRWMRVCAQHAPRRSA